MPDQDSSLQRFDVCRAATFVDVQAIRLRMQHGHVGTQLTEYAGRNLVGRTMGAVDHQLEPSKLVLLGTLLLQNSM